MNKNLCHIMVVDDDDRIRELVKQYLEENNFLVSTARDALAAKAKLEIINFDILILDIMMPGQSGLSLTKEQADYLVSNEGCGLDVVTGNLVNMVKEGIIDPSLVTKSALINAASVATTIMSTDCVINNVRVAESAG